MYVLKKKSRFIRSSRNINRNRFDEKDQRSDFIFEILFKCETFICELEPDNFGEVMIAWTFHVLLVASLRTTLISILSEKGSR